MANGKQPPHPLFWFNERAIGKEVSVLHWQGQGLAIATGIFKGFDNSANVVIESDSELYYIRGNNVQRIDYKPD